jgi:DNA-binding LacI/PurR family transcriptional regulator
MGPNGKQNRIAVDIRKKIRKGIYKAGDQLPTRVTFEQDYLCGPVTVQNAFNKLLEDGTVYSDGKNGTYISNYPPSLSNYAIVYAFPEIELKLRMDFYSTLAKLAEEVYNKRSDVSFTIYTQVDEHEDSKGYTEFFKDLKEELIAGVIFASPPHKILKTPVFAELMHRTYLPKVAFMPKDSSITGLSAIYPSEQERMVDMVFDYLEQKNVSRLALVNSAGRISDCDPLVKKILSEADRRGISIPKYNVQYCHLEAAVYAREMAHLLFANEANRPQALWVTNDVFIEAATHGLADAGVEASDSITVVSYCNFPENPKTFSEVSWYGLNVTAFVDAALGIMRSYKSMGEKTCFREIPFEYYLN